MNRTTVMTLRRSLWWWWTLRRTVRLKSHFIGSVHPVHGIHTLLPSGRWWTRWRWTLSIDMRSRSIHIVVLLLLLVLNPLLVLQIGVGVGYQHVLCCKLVHHRAIGIGARCIHLIATKLKLLIQRLLNATKVTC